MVSTPVLFNFKNSQNSVLSTDKKFINPLLSSVNAGIGIEKIKRNQAYNIELCYQNTAGELFRNQPIDGRNVSLIGLKAFMLNLGISFR